MNIVSKKSRFLTLMLCLFFGVLGLHKFYLRRNTSGLLMLITLGGLGAWAFLDFLIILLGRMKDDDEQTVSQWKVGSSLLALVALSAVLIAMGLWGQKYLLPKIDFEKAIQQITEKTNISLPETFKFPKNTSLNLKPKKDTSDELIKWTDKSGITHYTNNISKVPEQYQEQVKTKLSLPTLNRTR